MINDLFSFERLSSKSIEDLNLLFKSSGKKAGLNELKKKYNTIVFGAEYVGYIAYCNNSKKPAAFYGVLPISASYNNQVILIAQSADTITHPAFRKKGLFVALAKKTYSLCSEIGITVLFGIPNKYSFNGFINHLDWSHNGNFIEHTKKIKTLPISYFVSRFNGSRWPYSIMLKLWVKIVASYNQNDWGEKETQRSFYIPKTLPYKSYKSSPLHFEIKIHGVCFLISFNRFLRIGCIDVKNGDLKKALKKLQLLAFLCGCHKIVYVVHEKQINKEIEMSLGGFQRSQGLPLIQKKIDPEMINEDLLLIEYFDFDVY